MKTLIKLISERSHALLVVLIVAYLLPVDFVISAADSAVASLDNTEDRTPHRHQKLVSGGSDSDVGDGFGVRHQGGADDDPHGRDDVDDDDDDASELPDRRKIVPERGGGERGPDGDDVVHVVEGETGPVKVRQCEPMRVDLCQGLGYNVTGWPNLVGHESASDAEQQLRTFTPLIQYECSTNGELRLFLCAAYIPMCTEQVPDVIGPCRSVCERVRKQCEPVLQKFGFPWPPLLSCERFHARNNDGGRMCMEGPGSEQASFSRSTTSPSRMIDPAIEPVGGRISSSDCGSSPTSGCGDCVNSTMKVDGRETPTMMMDQSTAEMVRVWTVVWSSMSTLSTLFAILTFAVNAGRYSYSDRLVLLTATCSAVCAIAQLSRSTVVGSSTSSTSSPVSAPPSGPPCRLPVVAAAATAGPGSECTVMFVVVYYFSAATSLWWLVLTFVWTLQVSCRRWTDAEARRLLSTWFHLVCWSLPAIATVILLVNQKDVVVERALSESTVKICYVAIASGSGLGFVLVPLSVCLAVGIVLLVVGVMAGLQRRRRRLRHSNNCCVGVDDDASKTLKGDELLQQQQQQPRSTASAVVTDTAASGLVGGLLQPPNGKMTSSTTSPEDSDENNAAVRIGVFAIIGLVTMLCAVSSLAYDYASNRLRDTNVSNSSGSAQQSAASALIKVLSSVLLALSVGPWLVFTGHAAASWNSFAARRCHTTKNRRQLPSKKQPPPTHHQQRLDHQRNHDVVQQCSAIGVGLEPDDGLRCLHCGGSRDSGGGFGPGGNCSDVESFDTRRRAPVMPFTSCEAADDDGYAPGRCTWNVPQPNLVINPNAFGRFSTAAGRGSRSRTTAAGNDCCTAADIHRQLEMQRQQHQALSPPCHQSLMASYGTRHSNSAVSRHHQQPQQLQQKVAGSGNSRGGLVSCKFCRRQHFVENYLVI